MSISLWAGMLFPWLCLLGTPYGDPETLQVSVFLSFSPSHNGHSIGPSQRSLSGMLSLFSVVCGPVAQVRPQLSVEMQAFGAHL